MQSPGTRWRCCFLLIPVGIVACDDLAEATSISAGRRVSPSCSSCRSSTSRSSVGGTRSAPKLDEKPQGRHREGVRVPHRRHRRSTRPGRYGGCRGDRTTRALRDSSTGDGDGRWSLLGRSKVAMAPRKVGQAEPCCGRAQNWRRARAGTPGANGCYGSTSWPGRCMPSIPSPARTTAETSAGMSVPSRRVGSGVSIAAVREGFVLLDADGSEQVLAPVLADKPGSASMTDAPIVPGASGPTPSPTGWSRARRRSSGWRAPCAPE